MKLTKVEQARLSKLQDKKSKDLTDDETVELQELEARKAKEDDTYKGDLSQDAFDRIYAEKKSSHEKMKLEKIRADDLQSAKDDAEAKAKKERGEYEDLYKTEKKQREKLEEENLVYRDSNLKAWDKIKDDLPPKLSDAFEDGDDHAIIARNLAKYAEWQRLGLIDDKGNPGSGGTPPGGHKDLTWETLMNTPGLAMKIKKDKPELYEELKKSRKGKH